MGKSSSAGYITAVCSGAGLFKSSSKCSFHLIFWSSDVVRTVSFVSFTGFLGGILLPDNILVILDSSFMFRCSTAVSASVANSAIYFLLSSFTLFFTSLWYCLYYSWYLLVSARVLALFSLSFTLFLSSISSSVTCVIHCLCFLFFIHSLPKFSQRLPWSFSISLQLCRTPLLANYPSQNLNPVYTFLGGPSLSGSLHCIWSSRCCLQTFAV